MGIWQWMGISTHPASAVCWGGGVCLIAVVVAFGAHIGPQAESSSPAQAVIARTSLAFTNLANQGGTVGLRLREDRIELQALNDEWLTGLGFLNPRYHYVSGLPEGSITNNDLGSLSILMTMGIVGLLFAYAAPIAGLVYLLRRRRDFMQLGGSIYLSATLAGSITLATLSTVSGLIVLASILAICLCWTALTEELEITSIAPRGMADGTATVGAQRYPTGSKAIHRRDTREVVGGHVRARVP